MQSIDQFFFSLIQVEFKSDLKYLLKIGDNILIRTEGLSFSQLLVCRAVQYMGLTVYAGLARVTFPQLSLVLRVVQVVDLTQEHP